jgi:hypothetical protein
MDSRRLTLNEMNPTANAGGGQSVAAAWRRRGRGPLRCGCGPAARLSGRLYLPLK